MHISAEMPCPALELQAAWFQNTIRRLAGDIFDWCLQYSGPVLAFSEPLIVLVPFVNI